MVNNVSLKEMADFFKSAETILIFPHINLDGDALGSSAALCRVLRNMGKTSWVMIDEDIPAYIDFMDTEFCTKDATCVEKPDLCICVDCSEEHRMQCPEKYETGKLKLCMDHHVTDVGFGDYYYIDSSEAAASQLTYKLILAMDQPLNKTIAEAIYTGINTDTGSFQYSNTTAETHSIVSELYKTGIDSGSIVEKLYHTVPLKAIRIQGKVLDSMELLANGKVAVSYVSREMLNSLQAVLDDAESSIDVLRNIEGVEVAAFLKEKSDSIKVSMRSKTGADVREIAIRFGGGGHAKAAGCTLYMTMEEALETVKDAILKYWNNSYADNC